MSESSRLPAVLAYLPVIGWLYVFFFQRRNELAIYHLRQSCGLFLFLIGVMAGWVVIAWVIAWIPYMAPVSMALFALVVVADLYGVAAWIRGLINALNSRSNPLPVFGKWANRLPIH